jgi:putative copper resistance protein D
MLSALAATEPLVWISICVKALVYAASLTAAGSALCAVALRGLPPPEVGMLKRIAAVCAIAAALVSLARLPLRASFLMGGTWQGAVDPLMLGMVADSPLGTSIALRLVGLTLIFAVLIPARAGRVLAVMGAALVAASFVFRGHALEEPRTILGLLLSLHLLGLAFWIGAFAPLYRVARPSHNHLAGHIAHDFGRKAAWIVGILIIAGAIALWLLTDNVLTALSTPYGQFFAVKLTLFSAIMGLAAWNKLRLTPALLRQEAAAGKKLRQSIRVEAALVAAILLMTATLTTISGPLAAPGLAARSDLPTPCHWIASNRFCDYPQVRANTQHHLIFGARSEA